jgi:hypothetical protein
VSEGRVGRGTSGRKRPGASPRARKGVRRTAPQRPCEKEVADRPEAGRHAVKRVAVGGRMTARWSGAARTSRREPKRRGAVSKSNAGGFSTALDCQSPKWVFPAGARDVNVGCRNGFEASCRHGRGTPRGDTRTRRRAIERTYRSGRDWPGLTTRQGCSGQAKVARLAQAPRGWCPANQLAYPRAKSRIRGRRAGSFSWRALTRLFGEKGPGSASAGAAIRGLSGLLAG